LGGRQRFGGRGFGRGGHWAIVPLGFNLSN
jgi:hypothetical protein